LRCGTLSLKVRNKCVPSKRITMGQPHSIELSSLKKLLNASMRYIRVTGGFSMSLKSKDNNFLPLLDI